MRRARHPVLWLLILSCCFARAVHAQRPPCLPLAATNPDGNYVVPATRGGIVYRRVDGRDLMLDAWAPATAARGSIGGVPRPGVVVIHGGGFTAGSRVAFVGQFLELLSAAGYPWVSVDYRLNGPLRTADAADDVRAALGFVQCHASDLGIDPDRIVLLGENAGAALAADVAQSGASGVIGAVLLGGLFPGAPDPSSRVDPSSRADPGSPVAPGLPPTRKATADRRSLGGGGQSRRPDTSPRFLVVHGTADTEVPLARADAWCGGRGKDSCELLAIDGASHRPENWWPVHWGYKSRVVEWLNRLAPVPPPQPEAPVNLDLSRPLAPGLHKGIRFRTDLTASAEAAAVRRSVARRRKVGATSELTLDAWLPADRSPPVPGVVLVHGGGWEAGDRVTYITPLFEPLAKAGFAWFSVDYRLTPAVPHPEQLVDVRAALAFIRAHAPAFGIDAERLMLVGESASAQMATLLAASDRGLAGVVSFYGVYDFLPMVTDAGPRSLAVRLFGRTALDDDTRALLRQYSPLYQAHRDMVPTLLIHGTSEQLWQQGVRMAARLAELGVDHELVRLEGAPHGMENWEGHPAWQFYKRRLVSWLRGRFETRGPR